MARARQTIVSRDVSVQTVRQALNSTVAMAALGIVVRMVTQVLNAQPTQLLVLSQLLLN